MTFLAAIDGVTSFTGFWFANTLAQQGCEVVAFCQSKRDSYTGLKQQRLQQLASSIQLIDEVPFGSERHLATLRSLPSLAFYGRHAAYTQNYKSEDFAVMTAVESNTHRLPEFCNILAAQNASLCLTGSVFQQNGGIAYPTSRAFSAYGLSKTLTEQIVAYHAEKAGLRLGIFMIANPFGPWEEARFTSYLAKAWLAGQTPHVQTPLYIRDNIPIDLLARAYADYAARIVVGAFPPRFGPSYYAESQGAFTARFAQALRSHLDRPCAFTLAETHTLTEPLLRLNTDAVKGDTYGWDESAAWDALADYYREVFAG